MKQPTCHIVIGNITLNWVNNVRVESSWKTLTDTAVITLPSKVRVKVKNTVSEVINQHQLSEHIKVGDGVTIGLGYNGDLNTVFTGFVTHLKPRVPIEVICEDMMFSRMDARENAEYIKGCIESLYDSKRDSFFISPEWFSTWLETLPASVLLEWVEGSFEGQVKVGFFLGHVPVFFYGLPLGQLGCFNATGNPYYDELTIEYSDYLGNAEYRQTVINYFYSELTTSWKLWKLDLPGTISQLFQPSDEVLTGIDIHIESRPSHFVDLQAVITAEAGYLGLLGKNRRSQIRRSIRLLEEIGEKDKLRIAQKKETILQAARDNAPKSKKAVWEYKKGNYSLDFKLKPSTTYQLIASFIGYKTIKKRFSSISKSSALYCSNEAFKIA